MVSTVPFEVDLLAMLNVYPLLGAALLNRPRETLALLEDRLVRDVAASLLLHLQSCVRRRSEATAERGAQELGGREEHHRDPESRRRAAQDYAKGEEEKLLLQTAPPLKIRLTHLPKDRYMERRTPLQIRTHDEGKLVVITGRVARAEQGYQLGLPLKCPAGTRSALLLLPSSSSSSLSSSSLVPSHRRGSPGADARPLWVPGRIEQRAEQKRAEVELVLEANNVFHIRPDPLAASRRSVEMLFQDPRLLQVFQAHQRKQRPLSANFENEDKPSRQESLPTSAESATSSSSSSSPSFSDGAAEPGCPRKARKKLPGLEEVFRAFWESTRREPDAERDDETHAGKGQSGWDEWTARGRLLDAACPSLYGLAPAKLALLLTLISGCEARTVPSGGFGDAQALAAASFSRDEERAAEVAERGSRWKKFLSGASGETQREDDIWAPPSNRAAYLLWGRDTKGESEVKHEKKERLAEGDGRPDREREGASATAGREDDRDARPCATTGGGGAGDAARAREAGKRMRDEDRESGEGCTTRQKCHLLLLGASGTGKSTLLLAGRSLAQKAFGATGIGCTAAGLTCAAVRDASNGAWHLDPGILVLADDGVCCLDDLYLMKKDAQAAIHEAMEQQSISVAKAGLVTRLTARCSIIAASSTEKGAVGGKSFAPVSRLFGSDPRASSAGRERYEDLPCLDANMPPPLFSRFDAVVVLGDAPGALDAVTDFLVGRAVDRRLRSQCTRRTVAPVKDGMHAPPPGSSRASSPGASPLGALLTWTTSLLRLYLAFVEKSYFPGLSRQAGQVLARYYTRLRAVGTPQRSAVCHEASEALAALGAYAEPPGASGGGTGVTMRFFEGLFRLTQAHARLMARHEAKRRDAVAVIWMLETALCGNRVVPGFKKGGSDGVPEGRHGLLLLSQPATAKVVELLCVLPAREKENRAGSTASPEHWPTGGGASNGGRREREEATSGQLVYPSLQTVAGKALHCDIRSEAQYLAVEELILRSLGLSKEN
ncbi:putative MCM2/3/5 family DNA-dependent ATPase [Neospora caninum Liverpool]|uniref:Putative MCM2/3/5 family DNA-dependent ATPase n=1 Tax=Neospora caninum (strain Liverpool) TaxID=572307 RepID=F0VJD4_NEOCL|nr:putative MCM2/3/5 family DNA-dependent ATPase [Neospora caninum Liverpool]CBZ53845.1 putative MCM2/3/5 family DNA-dependent ATPase [Neospora caninum Liverpool]|eukprot:XP_003883877.1 putative MCM2/3/5 family DNA-dependent ATPase [Neospora caninum Liverpool]